MKRKIWCSPRGRQILESVFQYVDRNVGLSGTYLHVHAAEPCSGDRHFQMALPGEERYLSIWRQILPASWIYGNEGPEVGEWDRYL